MKTATIPSLRVEPELRKAAETILEEGETLSGFVEQALREQIQRRRNQREFIARGLAAREEARRNDDHRTTEELLDELDRALEQAIQRKGAKR
ncbi:YlcI/YnfO family protein [Endothiovibrio diazotrophicus]